MARLRTPQRVLVDFIIRLLVKKHRGYQQRFPNDLQRLRGIMRPGDVLLVEGSQRISEVIKYLTQSSWSHAALYVGDTLLERGGAQAREIRERFGPEADTMLIEATIEAGVAAVSLSKYVHYNIRICRPIRLRPGDLNTVLETVIAQLGGSYNVRQVYGLLRYFFPVTLIPKRLRRRALERSGRISRDLICSSQIAMAFQKVRYPIQPAILAEQLPLQTARRRGWRRWLFRRRPTEASVVELGVFTPCDPFLITPRDFDLSPYFDIVKLPSQDRNEFDYKRIHWVAEEAREQPAGSVAAASITASPEKAG